MDALRSRGPTGPDPRLTAAQLDKVEQALLQGAQANGFDTDLWTLKRGRGGHHPAHRVRYHPGHCLGDPAPAAGLDPAHPERRASERDEQAIARWVAHE